MATVNCIKTPTIYEIRLTEEEALALYYAVPADRVAAKPIVDVIEAALMRNEVI